MWRIADFNQYLGSLKRNEQPVIQSAHDVRERVVSLKREFTVGAHDVLVDLGLYGGLDGGGERGLYGRVNGFLDKGKHGGEFLVSSF